jgi:catechol 2,3-dioxygenase-like lactoylglutathione lyase family enzyme
MLDHVTLRTHDLEGTSAFFEIVLGLKPGYRPASIFPGYWLYGGGRAVVHLIPGNGGTIDRTGETIDHVAYQLTDHDGFPSSAVSQSGFQRPVLAAFANL